MWGVGQVKIDLEGHVEIKWYYSLKYNYFKGTTRKLGLNLPKHTTSDRLPSLSYGHEEYGR